MKKSKTEKAKNVRRLSIDITEEQHERLQELFDWGMKTIIFRAIIDDLIETLEKTEDKSAAVGAIIGRKLRVSEWSKLKELEKKEQEKSE